MYHIPSLSALYLIVKQKESMNLNTTQGPFGWGLEDHVLTFPFSVTKRFNILNLVKKFEKNLSTDDAFRRIHIPKMFGNGYEN